MNPPVMGDFFVGKSLTSTLSKRILCLQDMVKEYGILDRIFTPDSVVEKRIEHYTNRAATSREKVADTTRTLQGSSFGACGSEIDRSTHSDALDAAYSEAMANKYQRLLIARRSAGTPVRKVIASALLRLR